MSMSKKDYEAVANVLRPRVDNVAHIVRLSPNEINSDWTIAVCGIVTGLADVFGRNNPKFNRELFMQECGLPERMN